MNFCSYCGKHTIEWQRPHSVLICFNCMICEGGPGNILTIRLWRGDHGQWASRISENSNWIGYYDLRGQQLEELYKCYLEKLIVQ